MVLSRKWIWLMRLGGVLLSAFILWRLSLLVRPSALLQTWKTMRVGWFAASVLLYGLLLMPVAIRWHLVLKLSKLAISPVATFRYTIIGHLFYTLLFGWIGGDTTKAVLYSRQYRIPMVRLLATVPFDRFLGTCSSLLIAAVLLCIGLPQLDWHISWIVPIGLGLAIILLFLLARSHWFKPFQTFVQHIKEIGRIMLAHRIVVVIGIGCGLLCQAALSAVLALNLMAVSHEPLPINRMLWTFPAVVAISAFPISFGGLGAREAAAVVLFRLYGVSSAAAISASLLSFSASFFWALIGAGLLIPNRARPPLATDATIPTDGLADPSS